VDVLEVDVLSSRVSLFYTPCWGRWQAFFTPIPNPVQVAEDAKERISASDPQLLSCLDNDVHVHLGFREYLYGEAKWFDLPVFMKKAHQTTKDSIRYVQKGSGTLLSKATNALVPDPLVQTSKRVMTKAYDTVSGSMKKSLEKSSEFLHCKDDNSSADIETGGGAPEDGVEDGSGEEAKPTKVIKKQYELILDMVIVLLQENRGYELYSTFRVTLWEELWQPCLVRTPL